MYGYAEVSRYNRLALRRGLRCMSRSVVFVDGSSLRNDIRAVFSAREERLEADKLSGG